MNNLAFNQRAKWVWRQVNPAHTNDALRETQGALIVLEKQNDELYGVGVNVVLFGLFCFFGQYVAAAMSGLFAVFYYTSLYSQQLNQCNQIKSDIAFLHNKKRLYLKFKTLWLMSNDGFLQRQEEKKGQEIRLVKYERNGLFVWKAKNAQNKKTQPKNGETLN